MPAISPSDHVGVDDAVVKRGRNILLKILSLDSE